MRTVRELLSRQTLLRALYAVGFAIAALLVAASLQAGCGGAVEAHQNQNGNQNLAPSCGNGKVCAEGQVCSRFAACLPRAALDAQIGLALAPAATREPTDGRKLAPLEIAPADMIAGADGVVHVTHEDAVKLEGALLVLEAIESPMPASVSVTRPSLIPGLPKVRSTTSVQVLGSTVRPMPEDFEPSFTLFLARSDQYTLRAAPGAPFDALYPPVTLREVDLEDDTQVTFRFGEPGSSTYVYGQVLDAVGAPVVGVRVKAVDESGQFVSTVAQTDAAGAFVLAVQTGLRSYTLTFGPSETNALVPEMALDGLLFGAEATSYDSPERIGPFVLPAFPNPVRFQFALVGRSTSGMVDPVAAARVDFEAEVGSVAQITGVFRTSATSDADGIVTVQLVPGDLEGNRTYTVSVVPEATSPFAAAIRTVAVGPNGGAAEQIELGTRVPFTGTVESPDRVVLANVGVQARRTDLVDALGGSIRATTTDAAGQFALSLDPGTYTIEFMPPSSLPLPRWTVVGVQVPDTGIASYDLGPIQLPRAAVLEVQVSAEDVLGSPLSGIAVTAYLVDRSCTADACDVPALFLDEVTTDGEGKVQLLVPGAP